MSDGPDSAPFLTLTPAGCFHAVESQARTAERSLLLDVLQHTTSPSTGQPMHRRRISDRPELGRQRSTEAGLLTLCRDPRGPCPIPSISDLLPDLLPTLSQRGRVVLTESRQGLFLDYVGVSLDQAEELAVLASGLRAIADRRSGLLADQLSIHSRAFGIVDPAGNSEIGFWPLHIGDNIFTLTIIGIPLLQHCNLPDPDLGAGRTLWPVRRPVHAV